MKIHFMCSVWFALLFIFFVPSLMWLWTCDLWNCWGRGSLNWNIERQVQYGQYGLAAYRPTFESHRWPQLRCLQVQIFSTVMPAHGARLFLLGSKTFCICTCGWHLFNTKATKVFCSSTTCWRCDWRIFIGPSTDFSLSELHPQEILNWSECWKLEFWIYHLSLITDHFEIRICRPYIQTDRQDGRDIVQEPTSWSKSGLVWSSLNSGWRLNVARQFLMRSGVMCGILPTTYRMAAPNQWNMKSVCLASCEATDCGTQSGNESFFWCS